MALLAMGRRSSVGHGSSRRAWLPISPWVFSAFSALILLLSWPANVLAMRADRIAQLRQETVEMFYHGYDNYMDIAFPEDEVRYTRASLLAPPYVDRVLTTLLLAAATGVLRPINTRCSEPEQRGAQ
jgi:hypothetical protein